jgi:hypothetical protein
LVALEMRQTFRDACRVAYWRNGAIGLSILWMSTLFDLLKSALEERAQQGEIVMSRSRLVALAVPLTIIVGALLLVGPISDLVHLVRPPFREALWEIFHFQSAALSIAVMLPAFVGTWMRYKEAASGPGRLGLILNIVACGTFCLALSANFLLDALQLLKHPTGPNYPMATSIVGIQIGHFLFRIDALRHKLLFRWNAMPLLVGLLPVLLTMPTLFLESDSPEYFTLELTIASLQSATVGLCWVLMGIAMMGQRPSHEAVVA